MDTFEKVNWFEFMGAEKTDNNEGKVHGIVVYDEYDNFIEAFWYSSRLQRNIAYLLFAKTTVEQEA